MRQAPSMTGLRVLEAVVRLGSLSAAARELCVTPAAVSHRLRSLEAHGGGALVNRSGGRFVATEKGQKILAALGDAFVRIRAADAILSASGLSLPDLRVLRRPDGCRLSCRVPRPWRHSAEKPTRPRSPSTRLL